MNELDKMFDAKAPGDTALPPLVRFLKGRKEAGERIAVEVLRPDTGGGLSRTELVVLRWKGDQEESPEQNEWDDAVNAGLVDLGIRAVSSEQEAQRFALSIRSALRKVERRYGDGYMNAVLMELIKESELSKDDELAEVLMSVSALRPNRGPGYLPCRELIANAIGGRAVELRDKLEYGPEEIKSVMTKALAIYLSERFSVEFNRWYHTQRQ